MNSEIDGISQGPVEDWLRNRVENLEPPLEYQTITGGLSNLTFLVSDQRGSRWVLRRPPLGKSLGSAHDMGREVKVVRALENTAVPVPSIVGFEEDESVTGAPFYVMDFVDGPVIRSAEQADYFPLTEDRFRLGEGLIDTLVSIHSLVPDEIGLGDLGRRDGYVDRQLARWKTQWDGSKTRELQIVDEVHAGLSQMVPAQNETTIVHGDYRLDNVIFSPQGEVAAVVDWELCTLGDPMADLGLLMVYWVNPGEESVPLLRPATSEQGFPTRELLAERYAKTSGRDISSLDFFVALGYWKLAIILEGVLARFMKGAYGDDAKQVGDQFSSSIETLAEAAVEALGRLNR